jgi:hypothetical protein
MPWQPKHLTLGFASAFVLLLGALHLLEPEFNTQGHLISEYELGRYGWLMSLAFFCLAGASLSLWFAIRPDLLTTGGRVGSWWLLLIVVAYLGAGLFYPDESTGGLGLPPNPADVERGTIAPTLNATLHGISGIIVIGSSPIVFTLLSRSLAKNPKWQPRMRSINWATVAAWLGLLLFPISMVLYTLAQRPGGFDFRVIVSLVNRLMILAYAAWMAVVAWHK